MSHSITPQSERTLLRSRGNRDGEVNIMSNAVRTVELVRMRVRPLVWSLLAAAMLTFMPLTPAQAAQISVTNGVLSIRDSAGEFNLVDLIPRGMNTYHVVDRGTPPAAGPGCAPFDQVSVLCHFVTSVDVDAGPGDDLIGLQEVSVPVNVAGGAGADLLEGGRSNAVIAGGDGLDAVIGGAGRDELSGGGGDDRISGGGADDKLAGQAGDDILDDLGGGRGSTSRAVTETTSCAAAATATKPPVAPATMSSSAATAETRSTPALAATVRLTAAEPTSSTCYGNDQIQGAGPSRCGDAARNATVPERWPPLAPKVNDARASSAPGRCVGQSADPRPGDARVTRFYARQTYLIHVRVSLYDRSRRLLQPPFERRVYTRQRDNVPLPASLSGARSACVERMSPR